jgi:hypothetical protein
VSRIKDSRLYFYFANKLIMSGTAKEFIELGVFVHDDSNKGTPKEEDVLLQLGDRFTLSDFPAEGNSMIVRVIEMEMGNRFDDGDFIKYYLEEYKSK